MGLPVVVNVVAWAALATGVGVVAAKSARLSDRLAETEVALAASSARAEDLARERNEARAALSARPPPTDEPILEELRKDVRTLWAEVLRAPRTPEGEAAAAVVGTPAFDDAVRGVVDRYVTEKKFRDAMGKAAAPVVPKKPKFSELAKALELRPEQAERLQDDVKDIQTDLYEVLQIPRDDGVVLLEEIAQAEQYPDGSPQKTAPFLKLFKLKIPDTDETYVERAITLVQGLKERVPQYLAVEQVETLNSLDLDWFGIKLQ